MFTRRRKEAYEALHPETKHGAIGNGRKKSAQLEHSTPVERFTADTANNTGRSEQAIRRDVYRAEAVDEAIIDQIRGTDLDKGNVLDELATAPKDQQADKLAEIKRRSPSCCGAWASAAPAGCP